LRFFYITLDALRLYGAALLRAPAPDLLELGLRDCMRD
jgi:hypothetical protein